MKTARVIAFANQKGGVAKTTTTLNLGVAFKERGKRVLAVDLDPQGNLTMSQGLNPDEIERSMFDVLVHRIPIEEIVQRREIDIAVSSIDLAGAELALSSMIGRERALEKALAPVRASYDYILIDTPPSLGLLTINALVASNGVIVPVQCEYLSLRGLVQLENTLDDDPREPEPGRPDRGHPADDVRQPHAARARGDRDPAGELRRPRLQHADPQDDPLRRGAREGPVRAGLRPERRARPRRIATSRRRCSMARKRASMREGPLAELFRATEAAQRAAPSRRSETRRARADLGGPVETAGAVDARPSRCRPSPTPTPPRRSRARTAGPEPPLAGGRRAWSLEPMPEPAPRLHRAPRSDAARTSR